MKKLSTGQDSTLENWISLSTSVFGKDSKATKFLITKSDESINGIKGEVITDERQLLMVLGNLHFQN